MRIQQTRTAMAVYSLEWLVRVVTVVFLISPAILIVVLSFSSNEKSLQFPPPGWGLVQYSNLFGSDYWLSSIRESLVIAVPAAALATFIGVPAVLALERSRMPGRSLVKILSVAPLVLPGVAYAVALYTLYVDLHLVGSRFGLILANVMLALPFVILIVGAGLRRIPADLELVAMSLGASRGRATFGITLRLLAPSIGAAVVLAFVVAFDEAVLVNFVGGGQIITLPKAIFDSFRTGIAPLITAIAVFLMLLTGVLMLVAARLRRGSVEAA